MNALHVAEVVEYRLVLDPAPTLGDNLVAIVDRCGMSGHDLLFPLHEAWANIDRNRNSDRHRDPALNKDRDRTINWHGHRAINKNRNRHSHATFDIDRDSHAALDDGGMARVNKPGV